MSDALSGGSDIVALGRAYAVRRRGPSPAPPLYLRHVVAEARDVVLLSSLLCGSVGSGREASAAACPAFEPLGRASNDRDALPRRGHSVEIAYGIKNVVDRDW